MYKNYFSIMAVVFVIVLALSTPAQADKYANTISVDKKSEAVQPFFKNSYG